MPAAPEILRPGDALDGPLLFNLAELDRIEQRLDRIATALDSAFRIPGTGFRFGADSLLGLIPGFGDVVGLGLSGYLIMEARRLGAPISTLSRMAVNVGIDSVIGAVPLAGDLFDVFFKANRRNMALIRDHIAELRSRHPKTIGGGDPRRPIHRA